jgi:hypothetical protein
MATKPSAKATAKPKPKSTPKPKPSPSTMSQKSTWTEKELQRLLKQGMNLDKARNQASKKYGIWPNGYTN